MNEIRSVRSNLARLGAEFLVIVVGVLVALAVDEWRSDLNDARLRDELLVGVVADLTADSSHIAMVVPEMVRNRELLLELDSLVLMQSAPTDTARLIAAIDAMAILWVPQLTRTTFDHMVSSGALSLLDHELRRELQRHDAWTTQQVVALAEERAGLQVANFPPDVLGEAYLRWFLAQSAEFAEGAGARRGADALEVLAQWRANGEVVSGHLKRRVVYNDDAASNFGTIQASITNAALSTVRVHMR